LVINFKEVMEHIMENAKTTNEEKHKMENSGETGKVDMSGKENLENEADSNYQEEVDSSRNEISDESDELRTIREQLDTKVKQCEEYLNKLQRTMAEFDNFKKRTAKEKTEIYTEAVSEAVGAFLPVIDNLERAIQVSDSACGNSLKEGIEMVYRQFKEVMKNMGIDEIGGVGEMFDPNLHNAVMHITDESYGENVIVEEFQKGYILKDRVIRHSMVKVAN